MKTIPYVLAALAVISLGCVFYLNNYSSYKGVHIYLGLVADLFFGCCIFVGAQIAAMSLTQIGDDKPGIQKLVSNITSAILICGSILYMLMK